MKNKLIILGIIVVVIGYFIFSAWSIYTWSDRYLEARGGNWLVISKMKNTSSLIQFYTFFIPPVTHIGIVDKKALARRNDGSFFIKIIYADKDIDSQEVTEESFQYLFDCNNKREGWLKAKSRNVPSPLVSENEIEWTPFNVDEKNSTGVSKIYEEYCKVLNEYWNSTH